MSQCVILLHVVGILVYEVSGSTSEITHPDLVPNIRENLESAIRETVC